MTTVLGSLLLCCPDDTISPVATKPISILGSRPGTLNLAILGSGLCPLSSHCSLPGLLPTLLSVLPFSGSASSKLSPSSLFLGSNCPFPWQPYLGFIDSTYSGPAELPLINFMQFGALNWALLPLLSLCVVNAPPHLVTRLKIEGVKCN